MVADELSFESVCRSDLSDDACGATCATASSAVLLEVEVLVCVCT